MSVDMSKHFSTSALIRFTLPTIAMMIFTSCYTIVDGFFVSNYAGKTALAAVNLIFPAVMILASRSMSCADLALWPNGGRRRIRSRSG